MVRSLLQDNDIFLRVLAQRDDLPWDRPPFAPYAILHGGSADHMRAAQRPDLHEYPQAAWYLARYPDDSVREALAANPAIDQIDGFFEELAKWTSDKSVQCGLAKNPAIVRHLDIARKMVGKIWESQVQRALATNPVLPSLPADVVRAILESEKIFFEVLAQRDDLPWDQPPFAPYAAMRPRPAQPAQPAAQQQRNDGWIEIKAIHGRRYRYLRWREGSKKRSRYLGKEKE